MDGDSFNAVGKNDRSAHLACWGLNAHASAHLRAQVSQVKAEWRVLSATTMQEIRHPTKRTWAKKIHTTFGQLYAHRLTIDWFDHLLWIRWCERQVNNISMNRVPPLSFSAFGVFCRFFHLRRSGPAADWRDSPTASIDGPDWRWQRSPQCKTRRWRRRRPTARGSRWAGTRFGRVPRWVMERAYKENIKDNGKHTRTNQCLSGLNKLDK